MSVGGSQPFGNCCWCFELFSRGPGISVERRSYALQHIIARAHDCR
jgi:hypothetical protein